MSDPDDDLKLSLVIVFALMLIGLIAVKACDMIAYRKVVGVVESVEIVQDKKPTFWSAGEKLIKIKIKLSDKKEETLLLKGNKENTSFIQGEKYGIDYFRQTNEIVGKYLID